MMTVGRITQLTNDGPGLPPVVHSLRCSECGRGFDPIAECQIVVREDSGKRTVRRGLCGGCYERLRTDKEGGGHP